MPAYDAFLLLSFGGPEGPDDVLPFLENVTRGRGVPPERLAEVAEHYLAFGGISPINEQCRAMLASVRDKFKAEGLELPAYWGNRNWFPYLTETVRAMADDGVQRAIAFTTSAYTSYSSCRQYLEDIEQARAAVAATGRTAPRIDKIRPYFDQPGFIEPFAASTRAALATLPPEVQGSAHLVFTAHSIPAAMAAASGSHQAGTASAGPGGRYATELLAAASSIASRAGQTQPWTLVYQSRSGPPSVPWLEPDICAHVETLAAQKAPAIVVVPVGFVTDHMEVLHDLDTEAARLATELGIPFARAKTPGNTPEFTAMISRLVHDAIDSPDGPACPDDCCASGRVRR
jgi:ferrochelatase